MAEVIKEAYMYFSGDRQKPGVNTAIVRNLASRKEPISVDIIASEIGRSPPVVHSHLVSLSKAGIVQLKGDKAMITLD